MTTADAIAAGLRAWTRSHGLHVRAAAELLIEHHCWLRRPDFVRARVHRRGREAWIDWAEARKFINQGAVASPSRMAVLDLATAPGENRYRLSIMGAASSRLIATGVARATGEGL